MMLGVRELLDGLGHVPIEKLYRAIDGYEYVYYGPAADGYELPVGTWVRAGDVIGAYADRGQFTVAFCDVRGEPLRDVPFSTRAKLTATGIERFLP